MVKSKKSNCSISMDRISDLPDPLISHILSFLPTKEAVATSVLSTRWKFLWTYITNLQLGFDCDLWKGRYEMRNVLQLKRNMFAHFVNRVLLQLNSPSIQKFSLGVCCPDCVDCSYLNSWISAVFKLAFTEFSLDLSWELRYHITFSQINTNVTVLKLCGLDIDFSSPAAASLCFPSLHALHLTYIECKIFSNSSVSFPNLKIMRLSYVKFMDEDSANKLLSSSPVLDDLSIEDASYNELGCLNIRIPSLTRLSIELSEFYGVNKLLIDCCSLQYLNVFDGYPCEYLLVGNLSCLAQANAQIFFPYNVESYNNITKFVQSLSSVKFLSVSDGVLKAFRSSSPNITLGFHNLVQLEIEFFNCFDLCAMIGNFLECVDNLEHITIKVGRIELHFLNMVFALILSDGCFLVCCYQRCQRFRSHYSHPSYCTEPVNVPKCLLSRVAIISFSYMNVDCCDQLELLRYILKNAQALQLLTISINHSISEKEQLELVKKISLMPRGSRTCQVSFT